MTPGPRIYNLFPLMAGPMLHWADRLPDIQAMGFDWIYVNPFHLPGFSGSLYAVKDYQALHPIVQGKSRRSPDALIRGFTKAAGERGLSVMLDLVINHTGKDALLVERHPDWFRRDEDGGLYSPRAVNPDDPEDITIWGDLAEIDYGTAAHRDEQIAFWIGYMKHMLDLGMKGFRCDAAYQVPAEIWAAIIGSLRESHPGAMFFAETLGCTVEQVDALSGAGFDFLFNSAKWWDFRAPWLLEQYDQFRHIAPSVAFPESHDTERLVTELDTTDPETIERHYKLRYLFAALFSTGVMMPMGYELGFAKKLHVVETRPEDWAREAESPRFDLSRFVAETNRVKGSCPALNLEGLQRQLTAPDSPVLGLERFDAETRDEAGHVTLSLINPDQHHAHFVRVDELMTAGGVGGLHEVTPDLAPEPFELGHGLMLEPLQIRVFSASADV